MRLICLIKIRHGRRLINEDPFFLPPLRIGGRTEREYPASAAFSSVLTWDTPLGPQHFLFRKPRSGWRAERDLEPERGVTKMGSLGRHCAAERGAATPPGFSGCLHSFLGLGHATQSAKASSLRVHRKFGVRNGEMVGAGGWGEEEVGWQRNL